MIRLGYGTDKPELPGSALWVKVLSNFLEIYIGVTFLFFNNKYDIYLMGGKMKSGHSLQYLD